MPPSETYTGLQLETQVTIADVPAAAVVRMLIEITARLPFRTLTFGCGNPYSNTSARLTQPRHGSVQRALVDVKFPSESHHAVSEWHRILLTWILGFGPCSPGDIRGYPPFRVVPL